MKLEGCRADSAKHRRHAAIAVPPSPLVIQRSVPRFLRLSLLRMRRPPARHSLDAQLLCGLAAGLHTPLHLCQLGCDALDCRHPTRGIIALCLLYSCSSPTLLALANSHAHPAQRAALPGSSLLPLCACTESPGDGHESATGIKQRALLQGKGMGAPA
jgi:hypothetical protein